MRSRRCVLEGASRSASGKVALPRGGESREVPDSIQRGAGPARSSPGLSCESWRALFRGRPLKPARGRAGAGLLSGLACFVKALEFSFYSESFSTTSTLEVPEQ